MAASDNGPKPMPTAHEVESGCSLPGRRRFLKQSAGALATIATAGAASSATVPTTAEAVERVGTEPSGEAIRWMYEGVTGLFSSGYDKEDVEGMVAENTHLQIFEAAETGVQSTVDFTTEASNWVNPSEPETGELAELAWSAVRTTALQGLQDGNSAGDTRVEAREDAFDELSTPIQNYLRQANQHVYDVCRAIFTFVDEDDIPWDDDEMEDVDHTEGEVLTGFDELELEEHTIDVEDEDEAILEPGDVLRTFGLNTSGTGQSSYDDPLENVALEVHEYDLPNGETEEYYGILVWNSFRDDSDGYKISPVETTSATKFAVRPPDYDDEEDYVPLMGWHDNNSFHTGSNTPFTDEHMSYALGITNLLDAVEEIVDEITSEADGYIDDIFDAHDQGDIDDMDIVSGYDMMREYSDAGGLGRVAAEAMAMGLAHPEDAETEITLESGAFDDEKTGALFLDWDFESLETWEYSYSASDQELELDSRTSFEAGFIELEFHEDGDSDEDYTVEFDIEDIDDGVLDLSDDVDEDDELDEITVDAEGQVQSFIPVGEDTENFDHALFWDTDEEEQLSISSDDGIELLEVEGDDEDTHLDLETYQAETLDADRSVEQAAHDSDQYVSVDDLDEAGVDLPGLPSVPDLGQGASLLGLGLIGVVILAVIGFVTDLIPGLGN